ncbi:MAG: hypothetical protein JWO26_69 [Rhodospirillales bacterium]|nr:hypothetical protein [Rhodospirillales bacterium]
MPLDPDLFGFGRVGSWVVVENACHREWVAGGALRASQRVLATHSR